MLPLPPTKYSASRVYSVAGGGALLLTCALVVMMAYLVRPVSRVRQLPAPLATLEVVQLKPVSNRQDTRRSLPTPPNPNPAPPPRPSTMAAATGKPVLIPTLPSIKGPTVSIAPDSPFLGNFTPDSQGTDDMAIPVLRIEPEYPRTAASRGIEGWVKLEFTIQADGSVADIAVVDASPRNVFDRAALRALARWKFRPKIVAGKAVTQKAQQTIDFKLK